MRTQDIFKSTGGKLTFTVNSEIKVTAERFGGKGGLEFEENAEESKAAAKRGYRPRRQTRPQLE